MHNFQIAISKAIAVKDAAKANAKDQVTPSMRVIKPSTVGIAEKKRLAAAAQRLGQAMDAALALTQARDSGNPDVAAYAQKLLSNPQFMAEFQKLVAGIGASIPQPAAATATPAPAAAPAAAPDNEGVKYAGGGSVPGADARLTGPYTKAHLIKDLAAQNAAVLRLAPKAGMDAAISKVTHDPLVPPWDSNVWTAEARQYLRERATVDGWAQQHIDTVGDLYKLHPEEYDQPKAHPRDFDR